MYNPPSNTNLVAHILAGGQATRMQGKDKGLLKLNDKPLLQHVLERLSPQVSTILISTNRHSQQYQASGHPVISDDLEGFLGPLAGMHAALQGCNCDWLLTVPVDCPFIPEDLVQRLAQAVITTRRPLAVVHDGIHLQPTFCLLHQSLRTSLQSYLQHGGRKTGEWLRQQDPALADYTDYPDAFININTAQDLKLAEERKRNAG